MITDSKNVDKTTKKVYFIRVGEDEYKRIAELAEPQGRSINNMANFLLKNALNSTEA